MSENRPHPQRSIYVYPAPESAQPAALAFEQACRDAAAGHGFALVGSPREATVAVAPLLTCKLDQAEWAAALLGTLIFHPSALPLHRGPDAIRQALAAEERVSAASWFWCDGGLDTGPICEQEVVVLDLQERAREAYARRFIPAALRALDRALRGIVDGAPRRVPQEDRLGSYESYLPKQAA